jgi:hypothetical protein
MRPAVHPQHAACSVVVLLFPHDDVKLMGDRIMPLCLQLDTRRISSTPSALAGRMNVMLAYLKSYDSMGSAWLFCMSGCKCASQTINAHHAVRQSTVFLVRLLPTEHADCMIGVKVLHNTTSGKHKFKVSPCPGCQTQVCTVSARPRFCKAA